MTDIDQRFVREGAPIGDWMLRLVSADVAERRAAENAVSAMFYGLPTADAEFDLSAIRCIEEHQAAFYNAAPRGSAERSTTTTPWRRGPRPKRSSDSAPPASPSPKR